MEGIEGNGHSETANPDKSMFRIGEASRVTSTKPFVLRYWETEFPMLQPVKSPKGHRLYREFRLPIAQHKRLRGSQPAGFADSEQALVRNCRFGMSVVFDDFHRH